MSFEQERKTVVHVVWKWMDNRRRGSPIERYGKEARQLGASYVTCGIGNIISVISSVIEQ